MNETEAKEAIEQMIQFINSEANDRAMEIRKKTEEECTIGRTIHANF
jgi:vacuolar-type H+-ATPase subunit E/Vma4